MRKSELVVDPSVLAFSAKFAEFDEFNEFAAAWDVDFRQLTRGLLNASLAQIVSSEYSLSRAKFDQTSYQQGSAIPGMRTFALLDTSAPEVNWCGRTFSPDTIAIFPKDRDFRCVSPPGFSVYTFSFSEKTLTAASRRLGLPDICSNLKTQDETRLIVRQKANVLCHTANEAFSYCCLPGKTVLPKDVTKAIFGERIAEQLILVLSSAETLQKTPSGCTLTAAINPALSYIEEHLAEGITVRDVSKATGVSRRTLEYAFRKQLDASPKSFINEQRLILTRRTLRRELGERAIADIANQFGFWHMGQFARDYYRRFGELPSQTTPLACFPTS